MPNKSLWLVLALASAPAAAADVYKWIDAGGVVHYSDTEPAPELKAERVHLAGTSSGEAKAGAADQADAANPAPGADTPREGTQVSSVQSAERRCKGQCPASEISSAEERHCADGREVRRMRNQAQRRGDEDGGQERDEAAVIGGHDVPIVRKFVV